ncbi:MAG: type II toxin-antitoxin system VapC family toxin, partial [Candidatus Binatus sp.]
MAKPPPTRQVADRGHAFSRNPGNQIWRGCLRFLRSSSNRSMRFLLDTCVLSDFAQGQRQTLERIKAAAPEDLAASAITQMEIEYGLLLNSKLARRLGPVMDAFLGTIRVLLYDDGATEATAKARAILKRRGRPMGAYDILIAGTALAHDLILVTSNFREFRQVEGLIFN